MRPTRTRLLAPSIGLLLAAFACSSKTSPVHEADSGMDAPTCSTPDGNDAASFDLECTGNCTVSRHVKLDVSPRDKGAAACADGRGELQLFNLVGDDQSVLTLDLKPYTGKGEYDSLGTSGYLDYSVTATCKGFSTGPIPITLTLPEATDPRGTCSVTVADDCPATPGRALAGTFSCTLPVADRGASCTLKNGTFTFSHCE